MVTFHIQQLENESVKDRVTYKVICNLILYQDCALPCIVKAIMMATATDGHENTSEFVKNRLWKPLVAPFSLQFVFI